MKKQSHNEIYEKLRRVLIPIVEGRADVVNELTDKTFLISIIPKNEKACPVKFKYFSGEPWIDCIIGEGSTEYYVDDETINVEISEIMRKIADDGVVDRIWKFKNKVIKQSVETRDASGQPGVQIFWRVSILFYYFVRPWLKETDICFDAY